MSSTNDPQTNSGSASGRRLRLGLVLIFGLLLAACGSSTATTTPTTPFVTPSADALGSSTPLSTASGSSSASSAVSLPVLAIQYSSIATTGNAALAQCDKDKATLNSSSGLSDDKAVAQGCLTGYLNYVNALRAVNWGPVQPKVDSIISDMNKIDALMGQMTTAADGTTFQAAYSKLTPLEISLLVDANALRTALGLPKV